MNADKQFCSARTAVAATFMLCGAAAAHAQQGGPCAHYSGPIPGGHAYVQQVNHHLPSPLPTPHFQVPHHQVPQFIPGSRLVHAQPGVTVRDLERFGWKVGPNSEARKICKLLGC
jgi:hypothetical protein